MNRSASILVLALLAAIAGNDDAAAQQHVPSGIDHANIAVGYLGAAEDLFEKLGFSVKPGRPHKNSIANSHLKFLDGTELELITAREPRDSLAAEYLRYVADGDGGAFVALRVASVDSLALRLQAAGFPVELSRSTGMRALVFPPGHPLRPLWFLEFLRPYVDRPEFTTHRNSASRLRAVWLSSSLADQIRFLFGRVGIETRAASWPLAGSRVLSLGTSEIYLIPLQEPPLRPFVGATFEVFRLDETAAVLRSQGLPFTRHQDRRGACLRLTLRELPGFRLEFLQPWEAPRRDPSPRDVVPRESPRD